MAVTCVHDFILAVLSERPELSYFHVNELLCKAFENMLCLEVCDGDVQDQVTSEQRVGKSGGKGWRRDKQVQGQVTSEWRVGKIGGKGLGSNLVLQS